MEVGSEADKARSKQRYLESLEQMKQREKSPEVLKIGGGRPGLVFFLVGGGGWPGGAF